MGSGVRVNRASKVNKYVIQMTQIRQQLRQGCERRGVKYLRL
jgi:hypothetical protein